MSYEWINDNDHISSLVTFKNQTNKNDIIEPIEKKDKYFKNSCYRPYYVIYTTHYTI